MELIRYQPFDDSLRAIALSPRDCVANMGHIYFGMTAWLIRAVICYISIGRRSWRMEKQKWVFCRGDIYYADLDPVVGAEWQPSQRGQRRRRISPLIRWSRTILHLEKLPRSSWNSFAPSINAELKNTWVKSHVAR